MTRRYLTAFIALFLVVGGIAFAQTVDPVTELNEARADINAALATNPKTKTRALLVSARGHIDNALAAMQTTTTTTVPPTTTQPPTTTVPAPTLKAFPTGLVTTQPWNVDLYPYANTVTIKSVGWQTVEPSPGVYDWSAIDDVINATLAENPSIKFRIRLYAGRQSPAWLNDISGQCVWSDPGAPNGGSGCVPRYWTDAFLDRYDLLMDAFAAKYENDPRVTDVINSACTTIFAEPFILGGDAASLDRLWQAGLTEAGHRECLNRSMAKMMDVFPTTRVTMAGHNKWQIIVQGPNGPGDATAAFSWEKERALLNDWHSLYGAHMVVEEHSLNDQPDKYCAPGQALDTATSFYCWFASMPAPKGLQFTANFETMEGAARQGESMNSCFLEFASFTAIPMPARQDIHNMLVANCG